MPTPYRKDLLEEVWRAEPELLALTSSHRFRQDDDVNQLIFHNWALAKGAFYPIRHKFLGQFHMIMNKQTAQAAADAVKSKQCNMICINDDIAASDDFEIYRQLIDDAFQSILWEKSSFEKD